MSDPRRMTKRFTVAELKAIIVRAEFDCGGEGCEDCRYERAVTQGIEDAAVLERVEKWLTKRRDTALEDSGNAAYGTNLCNDARRQADWFQGLLAEMARIREQVRS